MESKSSRSEAQPSDFRCVQCGFPIKTLYIQYSPGNIRLIKCGNCRAVADEYIECEVMILIIDLILHKPKAYRHLFHNMFSKETLNFEGLLWKSTLCFLLLDAYRMWVLRMSEEWKAPADVATLLWDCKKMLIGVFLGNLVFFSLISFGTRKFLTVSTGFQGYKDILLAILISSYFKIFLLVMMVWEFPPSVLYIIDLFVMSSNTVALKVITHSVMIRCLAVCIVAHAMKFLATHGLSNYLFESY